MNPGSRIRPRRGEPSDVAIGDRYILCAIAWLGVFVLGLPLALNEFSRSGFYHATVIAWTHVMTLGILTQLLIGIWTVRRSRSGNAAGFSRVGSWMELAGFNGGLIWFLISLMMLWHRWHLTLAATVLGTTLMAGAIPRMIRCFRGRLPRSVQLSESLAWLALAVMGFLGFSLAHSKWLGFMGEGLTLHWIKTHFVIGASGWFAPLLLSISLPDGGGKRTEPPTGPGVPMILFALITGMGLSMLGIWGGSEGSIRGALLVWSGALLYWVYRMYAARQSAADAPADGKEAWLGFGMIYLFFGLVLPLTGTGLRASIAGTILILIGLFHVEVGLLPSGIHRWSSSISSVPEKPGPGSGAWSLGLAHLGLILMLLGQWVTSTVLLTGSWLLFSGALFTSLRQQWRGNCREPTRS